MKLEIGKILKAQGIKGEVKISCFLDDSAMLKGVKHLYIGSSAYTVEKFRPDGAFCYVQLGGVTDRNAAEALRNWSVYADKEYISVPQDRYFIADLIDCIILLDDGSRIGVVKDVLQYGAADVFVCSDGNKEVSFPFLKDLIVDVNVDSKTIVLEKNRFSEVAVYED